jgi:hypothetical protein
VTGRRRNRHVYPETAEQAGTRVIAVLRGVVGDGLNDATAEPVLRTARAFDHVAFRQLDLDLTAP